MGCQDILHHLVPMDGILMPSKRANLGSIEDELKVTGCLVIYCWFVCASGV